MNYQHIVDQVLEEIRCAYPDCLIIASDQDREDDAEGCIRAYDDLNDDDRQQYDILYPAPTSAAKLAAFLHEAGHMMLRHVEGRQIELVNLFGLL